MYVSVYSFFVVINLKNQSLSNMFSSQSPVVCHLQYLSYGGLNSFAEYIVQNSIQAVLQMICCSALTRNADAVRETPINGMLSRACS